MTYLHWKLFVDILLYLSGNYLVLYIEEAFDELFSVLVPLLACYYNLIPPMGGSFRCDDPSIQFPYQGDTVSNKILLSMVLLPLLIIVSRYGG